VLVKSDKDDWQLLYFKKSHVSHHILFIIQHVLNVFFPAQMQLANIDTTRKSRLNNVHFTR